MSASDIVRRVIGQQLDHLFRRMDDLEDKHGHWSGMPIEHFQAHSRLGHSAARLGICRDRILHLLEKEEEAQTREDPICQQCSDQPAAGVFRVVRTPECPHKVTYQELCHGCAETYHSVGYTLESVLVSRN